MMMMMMGFTVAPQSGYPATEFKLNWNLKMLVFVARRKLEKPRKTLGARVRTKKKLSPHTMPGRNRIVIGNQTQAALVGKRVLSPMRQPCSPTI